MCGLIGSTGDSEARYMVALGCLAEDRGSDSAGVAWQVGDKLRVAKVAKNPLVAYPVDLAPALRHAAKYHAPVIGHTRQATQGVISSRNAHPFLDEKSKIAWAHNGMIINDKDFGAFEVDSECLLGGIQKRDFSAFQGSIALLWIEEGKLHAFRKNNPLHRGVKRGAVYLASTADMLGAIGCSRIKELSEGFIYTWDKAMLVSTLKVPVREYSQYVYKSNWLPRGGEEINWHTYSIGGEWHNHDKWVRYDVMCRGCNAELRRKNTDLVPLKVERDSIASIEKEEMEESDRPCLQCSQNPRFNHTVWCEECLVSSREGWH